METAGFYSNEIRVIYPPFPNYHHASYLSSIAPIRKPLKPLRQPRIIIDTVQRSIFFKVINDRPITLKTIKEICEEEIIDYRYRRKLIARKEAGD